MLPAALRAFFLLALTILFACTSSSGEVVEKTPGTASGSPSSAVSTTFDSLTCTRAGPESGTQLIDRTPSGKAELTIHNGEAYDAQVKLIDRLGDPAAHVFIRASESAVIEGIPTGRYRLRYLFGHGWDDQAKVLRCDVSAGEFVDPIEFVNGSQFTEADVTLFGVEGGTAPARGIDSGKF